MVYFIWYYGVLYLVLWCTLFGITVYFICLVGARRLHPTRDDMEMMLLSEDTETPPEIVKMSDKFREELENTETGSVAFLFKGNIQEDFKLVALKF